jgi:hypothetical protein
MNRNTLRKISRRTALFFIVAFQLAHFILQMVDRWGPPRKSSAKLLTLAKFNELVWTSVTCFKITEHNVDVKLGRHVVSGDGIDALLWFVAAWSAVVVRMDIKYLPDSLIGLVQLMVLDVVMWMEILSSSVGLVERKEYGAVLPVNEKRDGSIDEKKDERVDKKINKKPGEKMEV